MGACGAHGPLPTDPQRPARGWGSPPSAAGPCPCGPDGNCQEVTILVRPENSGSDDGKLVAINVQPSCRVRELVASVRAELRCSRGRTVQLSSCKMPLLDEEATVEACLGPFDPAKPRAEVVAQVIPWRRYMKRRLTQAMGIGEKGVRVSCNKAGDIVAGSMAAIVS